MLLLYCLSTIKDFWVLYYNIYKKYDVYISNTIGPNFDEIGSIEIIDDDKLEKTKNK